jgi:predicted transcriptional regulator
MSYSIKINYEVSGEATPLLPEKYIVEAKSNPTIIAEGETVKLNFKADGMYFALKSRKGATATGATLN